jgi:glyoxylase-like metal-dependent hydrolase (beta-lactamase superfamily II)/rhodanese-related sulfurtransferase
VFSEQLNPGACKTYLVGSEKTREAVLIDPVLEHVKEYLEKIKKERLILKYIIDTHTQADHISGGSALTDLTGVPYVMHPRAPARCPSLRINEGDNLTVGDLIFKVLYTPGHTKDSVSLICSDRLFTGDALFIGEGGAGRTDLPGGDPGEHYDTLFKQYYPLDEHLLIYPAHDYHNHTHSTLKEEKANNERFRPRSRVEYIRWLTSLALPPADWMKDVLKANYSCAQDPKAAWIPVDSPSCEVGGGMIGGGVNAQVVPTLPAHKVKNRVASSLILDVREPEEYTGPLGHIEGSRLIPLGQLPARLKELESYREEEIITVCKSGFRSQTGASILKQAGFNTVYSMQGGMTEWNRLNFPVSKK